MQSPSSAAPEELLSMIRRAFAHLARLPDSQMFEPVQDYLWVESLLSRDGPWQDIPSSAIEGECSALSALTPKGFQFHLPAYLCWTVSNNGSSSKTLDNTVYALELPPNGHELRTRIHERFVSLSVEQRSAVSRFLAWAALPENKLDAEAAKRAAASYWGYFAASGT